MPANIQSCHGLLDAWGQVSAELAPYFDITNWQDVISNIGESITANAFDLMNYFTQAMFQLEAEDYYGFGISMGEAIALLVAVEDTAAP